MSQTRSNHVIRKYDSLIEAEGARSYLTAHGVRATIPDHHAITTQPHLITVFGGIRLMVPETEVSQAEMLLSEVERRSHLSVPEDYSEEQVDAHAQHMAENKKRTKNLVRFVLIVFLVYYALQAAKQWF